MKKDTLTEKETEIINLGASIAAGCQPCTKYHVKKCKKVGISDEDINSVIENTRHICKNVIDFMLTKAFKSVNIRNKKEIRFPLTGVQRNDVLLGMAITYSLNSSTLLEEYIKLATNMDIDNDTLMGITTISTFISEKAKAHRDIVIEKIDSEPKTDESSDCTPGCTC